jgi:hypothetical protein
MIATIRHQYAMPEAGAQKPRIRRGAERIAYTCSHPGCDKPHHAKLMCSRHYDEARGRYSKPYIPKYKSADMPRSLSGCLVPGCTRKHKARGFCQKHYAADFHKRRKALDSQYWKRYNVPTVREPHYTASVWEEAALAEQRRKASQQAATFNSWLRRSSRPASGLVRTSSQENAQRVPTPV